MDYSEIEIRGDNDPLAEAIAKAQAMFDRFGEHVQGVFAAVTGITSFDDLFEKIRRGIDRVEDAHVVFDRLAYSAKYFEDRAGLTIDVLKEIAEQVSKVSRFTVSAMQDAERALLNFRNVRGVGFVFQDALKAATDLAAVTGMDLSEAIQKLGEVLNDPLEKMDELKALHVTLTKAQQAQIAMFMRFGDIVSAQRVILKAFNDEIGGAGAKAADTLSVKMSKLQEATDATWNSIAEGLLPWLNKALDVMIKVNVVTDALWKEFLKTFGPSGMGDMVEKTFSTAEKWMWKFVDAGTTAFSYVQAAIEEWDTFSAGAFERFKGYAIDAALASLPVMAAWAQQTMQFMKPAFDFAADMWDWITRLSDYAWEAMAAAVKPWASMVTQTMNAVYDFAVGVWEGMVEVAGWAWDNIVEPAIDWSLKTIGALYIVYTAAKLQWEVLQLVGSALWEVLTAEAKVFAVQAELVWTGLVQSVKAWATTTQMIAEAWWETIKAIFGNISVEGSSTFSGLLGAGEFFFEGLLLTFKNFSGIFADLFPGLRLIGEHVLGKIGDYIADKFAPARKAIEDLKEKIKGVGKGMAVPKLDWEKLKQDFKDKMAGVPGFDPKADVKLPDVANGPELRALLDRLKKAKEDLDAKAKAGDPFDKAFQDNVDANRKKVQDFYDKIQGILKDDQYKRFQGTGEGFRRFSDTAGQRETSSGTGKFEDLISLNRRIQEAAAQPPELKELERQSEMMREELEIQRQMRDAIVAQHKARKGMNTPQMGMSWDNMLVPEGMGT